MFIAKCLESGIDFSTQNGFVCERVTTVIMHHIWYLILARDQNLNMT